MSQQRLFLSGGGDENQVSVLDDVYASTIGHSAHVLYIPVAWKNGDFDSCFDWLTRAFKRFDFKIDMWTSLEVRTYSEIEKYDSIYIGGGNTFSLLHDVRKTGFGDVLRQYIDAGKVVYGGSAGAIILGKDIRTAGLGKDADKNTIVLQAFEGLDLVEGFSIQCHYEKDQEEELRRFSTKHTLPILALSENSGIYVEGAQIHEIGEPALVVNP